MPDKWVKIIYFEATFVLGGIFHKKFARVKYFFVIFRHDCRSGPHPTREKEETKSSMDEIKYYTSLFVGALAINCVLGFLFLVVFVPDPAISTLMHDFVEEPVHCKVLT